MPPAIPPALGHHTPGTLDLEISNPALLLNEVARRYETIERILMEYVDNALDDAEVLYRANQEAYPYPIMIEVVLDAPRRCISIADNCRGMNRDMLQALVRGIGASTKRSMPWVNGRFGFGVHAFRAAAETIRFHSKAAASSHHVLSFGRDQLRGIREAQRRDDPLPVPGPTGTVVILEQIDSEWLQGVQAASIQAEIERHFERLLARPDLEIRVAEVGQPPQWCYPFDYAAQAGSLVQRRLTVEHQGQALPLEVCLLAAAQPRPECRPVFRARGRRVADFATVRSFIRRMPGGARLWNHPNLTGYVEVGELIEPVLNRDDFVRSPQRGAVFAALAALEPELRAALELRAPDAPASAAPITARLEAMVHEALTAVPTVSAVPAVRLVERLSGDPPARLALENGTLLICASHPDFRARLGRSGQPGQRLNPRLIHYLALLLIAAPGAADPRPLAQAETFIDQVLRLEMQLGRAR